MNLELPTCTLVILLAMPVAAGEWTVTGETLTDVPIQVGGRLNLQGPLGLQASTSLGVLPGPYVDLINVIVVAAGGYDRQTADLVKSSLRNSLIWRLHLGWKPWAEHGFYFEVGYTLAALGGGLEGEQLITLSTGVEPPITDPTSGREYEVSSMLHLIDLELGWRWLLWRGLTIRLAAGFAGTLGAQTTVSPNYRPVAHQAVERFCQASATYLDDIYTSYVFTPVFSVAAGWSF